MADKTSVRMLCLGNLGQRITLHLPEFDVSGELTHIHFEQPITTAQEVEGCRCYLRVQGRNGFSWAGTVPLSASWSPAHIEERSDV